jgi:DNA processing protein
MVEEKLAAIALNAVPYLFPAIYHRLLDTFESPTKVVTASVKDLQAVEGVGPKIAELIHALDVEKTALAELDYADRVGAAVVTLDDDVYPANLKEIYAPPPVLSIVGEMPEPDEAAVAVVGARAATTYGQIVTRTIVEELVAAGVVIVSGLARGIDRIAHQTAIDAGGRTVAVLGNGLNIYYPPENRKLQNAIPDHGAVVSQFPFAASPDKTSFPLRNRIVAGITHGSLVIEAAEKSGALITAYAALEAGREVFALPGPVNSKKSDGPNLLIQKGHAKLIRNAAEILDELPDWIVAQLPRKDPAAPTPSPATLTPDEGKGLSALTAEPRHLDMVAADAGLPTHMVSAILLTLELKGLARQLPGKLFVRS